VCYSLTRRRPEANAVIEVRGLTKHYGGVTAIKDITFDVARSEVVGILGPTAAGKTTIMRIITGFILPTAGVVRVASHTVSKKALQFRRHIGYLPESAPLYRDMSVRAYLDFIARLRGMHSPAMRNGRIDAVMERCQVFSLASRSIGKLSRGCRQRVGLAQALVHDPDILILDEPTAGLPPDQIIEVRDLIRDLCRDHTVILSTHIPSEVEHVCQRVVIINDGQLVAEHSREQLQAQLKGSEQVYIEIAGATPQAVVSELSAIENVRGIQPRCNGGYDIACALGVDIRSELAAAVLNNGWQLLELRTGEASLDDVFRQLTLDERVA
jgi:ABC-2 type transport system ATP-binding protein